MAGGRLRAALLAAAAVQGVGGAGAQTAVPAPTATPSPAATPALLPIPAAPVFVLPTPNVLPTPRASVTPRAPATPTPRPVAAISPPAIPSPRPAAATSPRTASTPPAPSPALLASPAAIVSSPAAASPTPIASPALPVAEDAPVDHYWLAALAAVVLAAAALLWVVLRRRRAEPAGVEAAAQEDALDERVAEPTEAAPVADGPVAAPAPAAPAPSFLDRPGTPPRARLTLAFRPVRAGLNLLSATSENEVTIVNEGDAPADDVRVGLRLVSAHGGLDAELAAIAAEPIGRAVVPPFALSPGERRVVSAVGALPLEAVQTLTAAGRPMFVPVVAVTIDYRSGDRQRSVTQAFAIGVERVDSAKLAPFWLDVPARRYDQVAARPHGPVMER